MKISSYEEIGAVLRTVRVALNVPLADLAETLQTSETLLRRQEQGHSTVAIQKLFGALRELGVHLYVDLPSTVDKDVIAKECQKPQKKRARP